MTRIGISAIEAELFSRSLADFIHGGDRSGQRGAWSVMEPGTPLDWSWHHDAMCEALEAVSSGEIRDLLVTVPPRTLKTNIISKAWPAWEWATRPQTRFLCGSYDGDLAIDFAVGSRTLIASPWYQQRWGDMFTLAGDQNVKSHYRNDRGGERHAVGVGGGATGRGADVLLADDPINVRDAHNRQAVEKAVRWWREVMPTRLNDPRTGRKVVVMQRVHADDVAALCIEAGYVHLNLPMEFDPRSRCVVPELSWHDPRSKAGELLHPERYGPDEVKRLKAIGSYAWSAQFNQQPVPDDDTAMFPSSGWQEWTALPQAGDGSLKLPDDALITADLTFTGKRAKATGGMTSPDHVVAQLWYRYGADRYLIDEARGQWSFVQTKRALAAFWERSCKSQPHAPTRMVVESKANGEALLSDLQGTIPGLVGWNPDRYGDKVARAWHAQPLVEAGQVWLPAGASWLEDWKAELAAFPNGRWDDRVDAFSSAMIVFESGRRWAAA